MRIAVTSSDGKNVNVHFGMAREFLIFDVDGDKMELKETRSSTLMRGTRSAKF